MRAKPNERIIILSAQFFCGNEEKPLVIARNKTEAERWLKQHGWRRCPEYWNVGLWEQVFDGTSHYAKLSRPVEIVQPINNE